jgi:hypothetical protein
MDSSGELKAAWQAIMDNGGPDAQPEAMRLLSVCHSAGGVHLGNRRSMYPEPRLHATWADFPRLTKR